MEEEKSLEQQVFDKINEQTLYSRDNEVYVLELDNLHFKTFTPALKAQIEKFTSLQVFSLISCELEDLSNFPQLPALVRLDLVNNKIEGDDLKYISRSRHLQTLMLSHNEIRSTADLEPLRYMTKLSQLDCYGNELENLENYRKEIFNIFPSLQILDQENKKGEYDDVNMKQTLDKVPSNLFEKKKVSQAQLNVMKRMSSQSQVQSSSKKLPVKKPAPKKKAEPKQAAPPKQEPKKVERKQPTKRAIQNQGKGKGKASFSKSQSHSSKSGIVFPVGRIGRYLKESNRNFRVSSMSKVYLAAVLEYLCAEVVELAGNAAKDHKKSRVQPKHIQLALRYDPELEQLAKNSVISEGGCVSTNFDINQLKPKSKKSAKSQ